MLTCKVRWNNNTRYLVAKIDSLETLRSEILQLYDASVNISLKYIDIDNDMITVTKRDRWTDIRGRMKSTAIPVFVVNEEKSEEFGAHTKPNRPNKPSKHAYRVMLVKDGANALAHKDPVAHGSMVACQCELENVSDESLPKNVALKISGSKLSRELFSFHDSTDTLHVDALGELAPSEKAVVVMKLRVSDSGKGPCRAFIKIIDADTGRSIGPIIRVSVIIE